MALSDRFKKISKIDIHDNIQEPVQNEQIAVEIVDLPEEEVVELVEPLVTADDISPQILNELAQKVENIPVWNDYTEYERREMILNFLNAKLEKDFCGVEFSYIEKEKLINKFLESVYGFGVLDIILAQSDVSAVVINPERVVSVLIDGELSRSDLILEPQQMQNIIKRINPKGAICKSNIGHFTVTVMSEPLSDGGKTIIIKNSMYEFASINDLIERDFLTENDANVLLKEFDSRKNILIKGGYNSGKELLLTALIRYLDVRKSAVLIEDFAQIHVENSNIMRFALYSIDDEYSFKLFISDIIGLNTEYFFADTFSYKYLNMMLSNCECKGLVIMSNDELPAIFDYIVTIENHKVISVEECH